MSEHYIVTGALIDKQTVRLDQPIPWPASRVRVTVELLATTQSQQAFLSKLSAIRQNLRASGYRSRTKKEIDAEIQAEREGWEK
ncbi:MAG: hypothetical protein HYR94_00055 [Chloroflexi bacterium]|nr:hypothetical protein [Chloroflexota bacterium]